MHILVCVKQVPDSTVRVKVAPDGKAIATDGITWAISAYDEYAVELALEYKDAEPATVVTAVSLGPARSRDALRQALAMGCDEAALVTGDGTESLGGLAIARGLAKVIAERKPDLIVCGKQASDDDAGLVGPALAEALGVPFIPMVTSIAKGDGAGVRVTKEVDGGHEVWRTDGPAVLSVHKSAKEPRYPSLPAIMKAKKKVIAETALSSVVDDAARAVPRAQIVSLEPPPARGGGKILKGDDAKALAQDLAKLLRDEAKVLS
ncbi:MAG: electron transfer flavoprotein subunit beta/FixA family protein [Chloroflexi bacterium]|nr:electron transfer flavoprotein subunit beta/FixA family protein [Chloroflexota bacterium]